MTTTHHIFLALGSNLGDRLHALRKSVSKLSAYMNIIDKSPIFETAAAYVTDQPRFLNAVIEAETALEPFPLLFTVKEIERQVGRTPTFKYGPRVVDIDILFYDKEVIQSPELKIPHLLFRERSFVLCPMQKIAPLWQDPQTNKTMSELLSELPDTRDVIETDEKVARIIASLPDLGHKPLLMGIINVTPDSFSGDGLWHEKEATQNALSQAKRMVEDGATILDVGGESSRPGFSPVLADEEIRRTAPVIAALHENFGDKIAISIDTVKPEVAKQALLAGATILNDISGLKANPAMAQLAADSGAYLAIMHNTASAHAVEKTHLVGNHYHAVDQTDIIRAVTHDLGLMIDMAQEMGVPDERLIIDPGLGFGKSVADNLRIVNELDKFKRLGYPVFIGPSRKSFIGHILNTEVDDRLEGTAATVAMCVLRGADIIRVHDVKEMARIIKMTQAILQSSCEKA